MAQINPRDINMETDCFAAVEAEIGINCGRLKSWKLYDLVNPSLYRTLNQNPDEILVAFTNREELEQWRQRPYTEPAPPKDSPDLFSAQSVQPAVEKLKTVGKGRS